MTKFGAYDKFGGFRHFLSNKFGKIGIFHYFCTKFTVASKKLLYFCDIYDFYRYIHI